MWWRHLREEEISLLLVLHETTRRCDYHIHKTIQLKVQKGMVEKKWRRERKIREKGRIVKHSRVGATDSISIIRAKKCNKFLQKQQAAIENVLSFIKWNNPHRNVYLSPFPSFHLPSLPFFLFSVSLNTIFVCSLLSNP